MMKNSGKNVMFFVSKVQAWILELKIFGYKTKKGDSNIQRRILNIQRCQFEVYVSVFEVGKGTSEVGCGVLEGGRKT